MKRLLLLMLTITIRMSIVAQTTNIPTIVEGRMWNVISLRMGDVPESDNIPSNYYKDLLGRWCIGTPHTMILKGDTVIDNITYKRLYVDDEFISALREENRRIYERYPYDTSEKLIIDFNFQVGDIIKDDLNQLQVKEVKMLDIEGRKCKCLEMWHYSENMEVASGLADYWIEGIGCMNGPHNPFWSTVIGSQCLLHSCYDGNECLFSFNDYKSINSNIIILDIQNYQVKKLQNTNNGYFQLNGLPVNQQPTHGIYIKDGKKVMMK